MQNKNIEIVIIEDEEDILELVEYHLSSEGYSVTGFLSTENVEQFLEEEIPSLMIVDRNLPGMEGSEFVRYLRDIGYSIPVIFLTAKDQDSDLEEGFNAGADDFITKPFNSIILRARISALLKHKALIDKLDSSEAVIFALANAIEAKDSYTEGHTQRVSDYAVELGKKLGVTQIQLEALKKAGYNQARY